MYCGRKAVLRSQISDTRRCIQDSVKQRKRQYLALVLGLCALFVRICANAPGLNRGEGTTAFTLVPTLGGIAQF